MHLNIRAFQATSDPQTCKAFKQEHRNVLKDYGITNVTTNSADWMTRPNIFCVVAEMLPAGKVVGGIRVEVSQHGYSLPVELAVGKMDKKIHEVVKDSAKNGGLGELCALWNSREVAGAGISQLLIRAGVSLASTLKIKKLICICAGYTMDMFQKAGFVVNNSLGCHGEFPYPNKMYTARVLEIPETEKLEFADPNHKNRIDSLRLHPQQSFNEEGILGEIKCDYNLVITEYK